MPLGMMQSKAEIRSVATIRKLSSRSNISRTLPLLTFLMPGKSTLSSGASGAVAGERAVDLLLSILNPVTVSSESVWRASSHRLRKVKGEERVVTLSVNVFHVHDGSTAADSPTHATDAAAIILSPRLCSNVKSVPARIRH